MSREVEKRSFLSRKIRGILLGLLPQKHSKHNKQNKTQKEDELCLPRIGLLRQQCFACNREQVGCRSVPMRVDRDGIAVCHSFDHCMVRGE